MSTNNYFTDTNFIISYLFFDEPEHELTLNFLNYMNYKLYYSEHILSEVEYVFKEKNNLIKNIFEDCIESLLNYHDKIFNLHSFINLLEISDNKYIFKHSYVSKNYVEDIIKLIWLHECSDNEIGLNLSRIIESINDNFILETKSNKMRFLNKFIKISSYSYLEQRILNKL